MIFTIVNVSLIVVAAAAFAESFFYGPASRPRVFLFVLLAIGIGVGRESFAQARDSREALKTMLVRMIPSAADQKQCSADSDCRKLVSAVKVLTPLAQLLFVVDPQSLVDTAPGILPQAITDVIKAQESSLPVFGVAGITSSPAAGRTVEVTDQGGVLSGVDTSRKIVWGHLLGEEMQTTENQDSTSSPDAPTPNRLIRSDEDANRDVTKIISDNVGDAGVTPGPSAPQVYAVDSDKYFFEKELESIINPGASVEAKAPVVGSGQISLIDLAKGIYKDVDANATPSAEVTPAMQAAVQQLLQHPQDILNLLHPGQVDPAEKSAQSSEGPDSTSAKRPPTQQQQQVVKGILNGKVYISQGSRTGGDGGMQDPGGQTGQQIKVPAGATARTGSGACITRPGSPVLCR